MSDIELNSEVRSVIENIYAGLDLAKPAHVGVRLAIDVGGADTINVVQFMTESIEIAALFEELSPLETMFHLAPHEPGTPESELNAVGLISPRINTAWEIKDEEVTGIDLL